MPNVTRKVTHRDGSLEGTPDPEGSASREKESQRDLTSLSTPVPNEEE